MKMVYEGSYENVVTEVLETRMIAGTFVPSVIRRTEGTDERERTNTYRVTSVTFRADPKMFEEPKLAPGTKVTDYSANTISRVEANGVEKVIGRASPVAGIFPRIELPFLPSAANMFLGPVLTGLGIGMVFNLFAWYRK